MNSVLSAVMVSFIPTLPACPLIGHYGMNSDPALS